MPIFMRGICKEKIMCPNCKSKELITSPNRYDILEFENGEFQIVESEFIDDGQIFCRECGIEVEVRNDT